MSQKGLPEASALSVGEGVGQDPLVRGQDLSLVTWDTVLFNFTPSLPLQQDLSYSASQRL